MEILQHKWAAAELRKGVCWTPWVFPAILVNCLGACVWGVKSDQDFSASRGRLAPALQGLRATSSLLQNNKQAQEHKATCQHALLQWQCISSKHCCGVRPAFPLLGQVLTALLSFVFAPWISGSDNQRSSGETEKCRCRSHQCGGWGVLIEFEHVLSWREPNCSLMNNLN